MGVSNVAAVFAPNLLRPLEDTLETLRDTVHVVNLLATLLVEADALFGAAPAAEPVGGAAAVDVSDAAEASPEAPRAGKPWFYLNGANEQQGPVGWAELQRLFRSGVLDSGTFVFTDGMANWAAAGEVGLPGAEP